MITRYADAWRRSDIAETISCYHDDVTAHYGGTSTYAGTHRGRDQLVDHDQHLVDRAWSTPPEETPL